MWLYGKSLYNRHTMKYVYECVYTDFFLCYNSSTELIVTTDLLYKSTMALGIRVYFLRGLQ